MAIRITVATNVQGAIVLCCARDEQGDVVSGASWTEIAWLPGHSRQEFLLGPDRALLIAAEDTPAPGDGPALALADQAEMLEAS